MKHHHSRHQHQMVLVKPRKRQRRKLITLVHVDVNVTFVFFIICILSLFILQQQNVVFVESYVLLFVLPQQPRLLLLSYQYQAHNKQQLQAKLSSKDYDSHHNHEQYQQFDRNNDNNNNDIHSVRLNKVFKDHYSRRQADELIKNGRVSINGIIINDNNIGCKVIPYHDVVTIDNIPYINWEQRLGYYQDDEIQRLSLSSSTIRNNNETSTTTFSPITTSTTTTTTTKLPTKEVYIKYWKPVGVTCTTDRNIPNNLIDSLLSSSKNNNNNNENNIQMILNQYRIFNVGRLDKDTSGLLLLTSDGAVPNYILRKQYQHSKNYIIITDMRVSDEHIQQLRDGVVITTDTIRQKKHIPYTAITLPCNLKRIQYIKNDHHINHLFNNQPQYLNNNIIQMTLYEGKNHQIRIMLSSLGYQVVILHRIEFCDITLSNLLYPNDYTICNNDEINIIQNAIHESKQIDNNEQQQNIVQE